VQSARPEISSGPVPPIFDARIHGIGNDIPNLDAARRSDFDSLGGRNRIKNISPSGSFGERLAAPDDITHKIHVTPTVLKTQLLGSISVLKLGISFECHSS
jgi:hypothetical protein